MYYWCVYCINITTILRDREEFREIMKEKKNILEYCFRDNVNILKTIFTNKINVSRETLEELLEEFNENNLYIKENGGL